MPKRKLGDHNAEKSSGSSPCRNYCVVIHSGKHKSFAELLCQDLHARGCPAYFDADSDSQDKSDASVHATVEVAAAARLAILLLSDEFFTATKWPMLEFSAFVQKYFEQIKRLRNVKFILPVYFRMSVTNFVCTKSYLCDRQYRPIWNLTHWEDWARADLRVHLQDWEVAWSMIKSHESVHVCIPHGSCDWTRHSQRILDDEQGRGMVVERVLTDPKLGFSGTTIQRFAHAATDPERQHVHATQPQPQQIRRMPGASQQAQEMTDSSQQVHTVRAAQVQHEVQSTPPGAWSHAPDNMTVLPPAPSAIPQPVGRMHSLFTAAQLQLRLSASVSPRSGEDSRDEEDWSDGEHEEHNGCESAEKESGESEYDEPEDIEEDDYVEGNVDNEDEEEDDDDDDDDYEEDSGSDGDHSG